MSQFHLDDFGSENKKNRAWDGTEGEQENKSWEHSFKYVAHNTAEDGDYHSDNGTSALSHRSHR